MSDYHRSESEESLFNRQGNYTIDNNVYEQIGDIALSNYSASLHSSLVSRRLGGQANGERTAATLRGAQATYGNRAVQRYLGREAASGRLAVQRWPGDEEQYLKSTWGKRFANRDEPNKEPDPLYARENEAGGYEAGKVGERRSATIFGVPVSLEQDAAQVKLGTWGPEGARRSGFKATHDALRAKTDEDRLVSVEVGVGTSGVEASRGEDGATYSAGANLIEASVILGRFTPGNRREEQVRVGASLGSGGGFRVHSGDSDGDGSREGGAGIDVGPFNFDLKTEDPMRTFLTDTPADRFKRGVAPLVTTGMKKSLDFFSPIGKDSQMVFEKNIEKEHARRKEEARQREIQSKLYRIMTRAQMGGAVASTDDIATRIGADERLQFLLTTSGKSYE